MQTGGWFWHQNPCILAVPTAGLTFPGETCFSPFTLLQESVTANCLADSSGGRGKVHTPSIMNEPVSCAVRWELGQISPVMELKSSSFICTMTGKSESPMGVCRKAAG